MGAWGTGFYSDDTTSDVRDTYLDLLRKRVPPEEAVAQMLEEWKPDRDEECGISFGSPLRSFSGNTVICPGAPGEGSGDPGLQCRRSPVG